MSLRLRSTSTFEHAEACALIDGVPYSNYRAFRAALLTRLQEKRLGGDPDSKAWRARPLSLSGAKQQIQRFRACVRSHGATFVYLNAAYRKLVLQALGIPDDVPVLRQGGIHIFHWLLWQLRPDTARFAGGRALLARIRTFAGRQLAYTELLRTYSLPEYFDVVDDVVWRRVRRIRSVEQCKALSYLPGDLLVAGLQLGAVDASELLATVQPFAYRINAQAIRILVEEGILTAATQLTWLTPYLVDPHDAYAGAEHVDATEFRNTVRLLRDVGVTGPVLVGVVKRWARHDADALLRALHVLRDGGVTDIDAVFRLLGSLLWTTETTVLSFVVQVIGAHEPLVLGQFREVLASDRIPARGIVDALLAHGATARDMTQCQRLLIETAQWGENAGVERLPRLLSPPYALTFPELDRCASYLKPQREDRFGAFLDVLIRFELADAKALDAFRQVWDTNVSPILLFRLLELATSAVADLSVDELATWVVRSHGKCLDTMVFIQTQLGVPSTVALLNLAKLGELSLSLVYYLIEIRGIRTFGQLMRWYFEEGVNANAHRSDGDMKPNELELVLFKFATTQADFSRVGDNYACIVTALYDYARQSTGEWSLNWNEVERATYFTRTKQAYADAATRLRSQLPYLLKRTEGRLLRGVIDGAIAGDVDLEALLDSLGPLVDGLLHGRDDEVTAPTPLIIDAVSLVYGVPQPVVAGYWHKVGGKSHHLAGLILSPGYAMQWDRITRYAEPLSLTEAEARQLQLDSFLVALDVLQAWRQRRKDDQAAIFNRLDLRALHDDAAQPARLAAYLGLLLCIADSDPLTHPLLDTLSADVIMAGNPSTTYDGLIRLDNFVGAILPEGIVVGQHAFLSGLADETHERLLCVVAQLGVGDDLLHGIATLQKRVLRPFTSWIARDRKRFPEQRGDTTSVVAYVSKSPAAFFARHSVMLCTRDNIALWDEDRHCHLVVFDHTAKRLVGMAMLYFQTLPGYFRGQRCLIFRAINLTSAALSSFDRLSVVTEFVRITEMIGRENQVAAVLFPNEATLLTNQPEIQRKVAEFPPLARARKIGIEDRQAKQALFYAFEHGRQDGAVQWLQVLWQRNEEGAD